MAELNKNQAVTFLADVLASFVLGPIGLATKLEEEDVECVSSVLERIQPGDAILTKTPGALYELGRTISGYVEFDHVVSVIDDENCLNTTTPYIRRVPKSAFLTRKKNPLVVRFHLSQQEREAYIRELSKLEGQFYDVWRGMFVFSQLALGEKTSNATRSAPFAERVTTGSLPKEWICTDAALMPLMHAVPKFKQAVGNLYSLDASRIGSFSCNDFLVLAQEHPELCTVFDPYLYQLSSEEGLQMQPVAKNSTVGPRVKRKHPISVAEIVEPIRNMIHHVTMTLQKSLQSEDTVLDVTKANDIQNSVRQFLLKVVEQIETRLSQQLETVGVKAKKFPQGEVSAMEAISSLKKVLVQTAERVLTAVLVAARLSGNKPVSK
eukprot:Filipodium_phascolosomae@DN6908_c0_g1_i1.p1